MLTDQNFIWNEAVNINDYITAIKTVLNQSPSVSFFTDPQSAWPSFMARVCREYGVNPAWILVSFEREQGLLSAPVSQLKPWSWEAATGFVGQDQPGTSNPLYLGFPGQIWRCARQTGWLTGQGPIELYGGNNTKLMPTIARWKGQPITINLLDSNPPESFQCLDLATYCQLMYTPHYQVLASNGTIYQEKIAVSFDPLI